MSWSDGSMTPRTGAQVEARARIPGVIYAADFGVLADNSTDDRAALQAAIDYADTTVIAGRDSTTILLPEGTIMVGNQVQVKNGVALRGVTKAGSKIKAISGTFPTNTPVVRLGDGSTIVFQCRLENLNVDCDDISGSTCVYSTEVQEGSGLLHVGLFGHRKYGAEFDASGCSQFALHELEVYCGTDADKGIYLHGCAGTNTVEWVTTNCAAKAASVGVHVSGGNFNLKQIHTEQSVDGVYFESGSGIVDGLLGESTITNLLHLGASTNNVTARNIDRSSSTHTLLDSANFITLDDSNVLFYCQGVMYWSGGTPVIINRGSIPSTSGSIKGTICWNNNPSTGNPVGWICTVSGSPDTWKGFGVVL